MRHSQQHEERVIGFALGDGAEPGGPDRDGLVEQLVGCDACQAYGYRVLADLPLMVSASGVDSEAAERLERSAVERLGGLLSDATGRLDEMEARVRPVASAQDRLAQVHRFPAPSRSRGLGPGLVLALAAGLAILVVISTHREPRLVEEAFARAQLAEAREGLPSGYAFSPAAPPSPFWRGYSLGLLTDVERAGFEGLARDEILETLLSLAKSPDGGDWQSVKRDGCAALTADARGVDDCARGLVAYQLRRDLVAASDDSGSLSPLLRSDEARDLLSWAEQESRGGRAPAPVGEQVRRLRAAEERRDPVEPGEASGWIDLIRAFLLRG